MPRPEMFNDHEEHGPTTNPTEDAFAPRGVRKNASAPGPARLLFKVSTLAPFSFTTTLPTP